MLRWQIIICWELVTSFVRDGHWPMEVHHHQAFAAASDHVKVDVLITSRHELRPPVARNVSMTYPAILNRVSCLRRAGSLRHFRVFEGGHNGVRPMSGHKNCRVVGSQCGKAAAVEAMANTSYSEDQ